MENIYDYLMSVIVAALICSIVSALSGKKGKPSAVIRLLLGVYMSVAVCRPILEFLPSGIAFSLPYVYSAEEVVEEGKNMASIAIQDIIKEKTDAYILDKARSLEASISVNTVLSDTDPPIPEAVEISGNIAPYAKQQLVQYIENQLGIPKEAQLWSE